MDGFWVNDLFALWEVAGILLPYRRKREGERDGGWKPVFGSRILRFSELCFLGNT
jgi:hypothetical protein